MVQCFATMVGRIFGQRLEMLADGYGKRLSCHDALAEVNCMLDGNSMDAIFQSGLHEFLTEFIDRNNRLTQALSESYNFY